MKRTLSILLLFIFCHSTLNAQQNDSIVQSRTNNRENIAMTQPSDTDNKAHPKFNKRDLIPKFTATVLGRYEFNTELYTHHFELRHTRIGMYGTIHPMFSYMALVDLTYGGKFSPVAIFAKFMPVKGLSFLIGFDKMPFSNENLLSPYQYYFSDKSFLTQKITA